MFYLAAVNRHASAVAKTMAAEGRWIMDSKVLMTGLTIAIGGLTPAFAIGWITSKAVEAIGRNPEAASEIRTAMILGAAFAEAIAIYALVVALIIKFT